MTIGGFAAGLERTDSVVKQGVGEIKEKETWGRKE